jgi:hypothetical protein
LSITQPLTILLLRLSSRLRVIALNHPIDSVSMTVGLMSCTLSSFLLPKAPPKANLMLESLHYSIIPPLNPPSYLTPPPTLVVQLLWNRLMISSLVVTRSLIHHHHLPTFVLSIATCAMVMPSKHDALPLEPLLDLLRILAPVHFLLPSMLLTLLSGCCPLMSRSFVTRWLPLIGLHCMLKTRRSSSPISSAKSAAPPVRPVASHTTTIAISFSVTLTPSTPSPASAT